METDFDCFVGATFSFSGLFRFNSRFLIHDSRFDILEFNATFHELGGLHVLSDTKKIMADGVYEEPV